jgi:hypothetical protein
MTPDNALRTRIFRDAAGRCYRWQERRDGTRICIRRCQPTPPFALVVRRRQSKKQRLAQRRAAQ